MSTVDERLRIEARLAAERVLAHAERDGFAGYDPYDGLSGPVGRLASRRRTRQLVVQAYKRAPVGLRVATGVRPTRMSKALALYAQAADRLGQKELARQLVEDVIERGQPAWGYEFDVQTRWAFYPAGSPNIIATSFVMAAVAEVAPDLLANGALASWLRERLVTPEGWVRYVPTSQTLVHNANVLGALTLARLGAPAAEISRTLAATLAAQRADGSWQYGDAKGLDWVDNFHTVYVLCGLMELSRFVDGLEAPLARGVEYWRSRLFDDAGRPYYTPGKRRADVHNSATALKGLVILGRIDRECARMIRPAFLDLIAYQRSDGGFRSHAFSQSYARWDNAHAADALSLIAGVENCV